MSVVPRPGFVVCGVAQRRKGLRRGACVSATEEPNFGASGGGSDLGAGAGAGGGGGEKRKRRGRVFRPRTGSRKVDDEDGAKEQILSVSPSGVPLWPVEYSREFLAICQAQFEGLAQVINASLCVLYLRRDAPQQDDGAGRPVEGRQTDVEFIPVCTYPEHSSMWVVGKESKPAQASRQFPGGVAASALVPEYPYLVFKECDTRVMEDGSLSMPILVGQDVAGMLVVWKNDAGLLVTSVGEETSGASNAPSSPTTPPSDREQKERTITRTRANSIWSAREKEDAQRVANTLALACALDQRTQASERLRREQLVQHARLRSMLSSVLHQVRSPLAALLTFGKLLLRRLPVGDVSRDLANDIIVQSERMRDLLIPLDQPAAEEDLSRKGRAPFRLGRGRKSATDVSYFELDDDPDSNVDDRNTDPNGSNLQICWLTDVAVPLLRTAKVMAAEAGLRLILLVDEDAPPCLVDEKGIREAMANIVDNAIVYTPSPGTVEITLAPTQDDCEVMFRVRDTGYGIDTTEREKIFERGYRGQAAKQHALAWKEEDVEDTGRGLGLTLARDLVHAMNGSIGVESPSGIGGFHPGTSVTIRFHRSTSGPIQAASPSRK